MIYTTCNNQSYCSISFSYSIIDSSYSIAPVHALRSNRDVSPNWNALLAAAETKNKLSLRMKTALFTDLRYFFSTCKGIGTRAGAVKS